MIPQIGGVITLSINCPLSSFSTSIFLDRGQTIRGHPTRITIQLFASSELVRLKMKDTSWRKGFLFYVPQAKYSVNGVILEQSDPNGLRL